MGRRSVNKQGAPPPLDAPEHKFVKKRPRANSELKESNVKQPKRGLLESDASDSDRSEDIEANDGFDSENSSSEIDWSDIESDSSQQKLTAANIEALSFDLDKAQQKEQQLSAQELQDSSKTKFDIIWDAPALASGDDLPAMPHSERHWQIQHIVGVLSNWTEEASIVASRAQYIEQLLFDICSYYSYSRFMAEKLFNLFSPQEAFEFFEANETKRPIVIRVNTLKTQKRTLMNALINRGMNIKSLGKWTPDGLVVFDSQVPIGATPEYLAGHYMLQAASSLLPVIALDPKPNERILDMSSAPGGKVTNIASLQRNTGIIVANDANKQRCKALVGNLHRMSVRNVIVSNYDGRKFPQYVMGGFNRVLLDAPCSGTGVIFKDPSIKTNKNENDFKILSHLQKQLLLSAIDSADCISKSGHGIIVYSTCSVSFEENEAVVNYALKKRDNIKLVDTGIQFGQSGFSSFRGKSLNSDMSHTRRFYPHTHNMDGFFVAKFEKFSNKYTQIKVNKPENIPTEPAVVQKVSQFDDEQDQRLIERSRKAALRRKGIKVISKA